MSCTGCYLALICSMLIGLTNSQKLHYFTIYTSKNDGFSHFMESAEQNNISIQIIESNKQGQSFESVTQLLNDRLQAVGDNDVVLFTENSDTIILQNYSVIVNRFMALDCGILFAADTRCEVGNSVEEESTCPGSVGFISLAPAAKIMLKSYSPKFNQSPKEYFKSILTDQVARNLLKIELDTQANIFQNLNQAFDKVLVKYSDSNKGYLFNVVSNTSPAIAYGDEQYRVELNTLSNFLGESWSEHKGCLHCFRNKIDLTTLKRRDYPTLFIALFVEKPTPFIEEFFMRIRNQSYPKKRVDIHIYSNTDFHERHILKFQNISSKLYRSFNVHFEPNAASGRSELGNFALSDGLQSGCDFIFLVNSVVQLTNKNTILDLVSQNRSILAPMVKRRDSLWANFWAAMSQDGFYARSDDYVMIVEGVKKGVWNVPLLSEIYMIRKDVLPHLQNAFKSEPNHSNYSADMVFSLNARRKHLFMYVTNMNYFGHMVISKNFNTVHLHNDLWEIFDNNWDWEQKYLHPLYDSVADSEVVFGEVEQPCPDVFWVPLLSETFCQNMIEEMEHFGEWSSGQNTDPRLEGGYENVPTRDIHMRQVDWESHWIYFLRTYVYPLQTKLFQGHNDTPRARMNFVVRYKPDEQPALRPHHDSSSYSINIALNMRGRDYEGGGTHFLRYKCTVLQSRLGWALLHPGRVTHYHEGLRTTNGTRYIFVTFVNP